MGHLSVLVSSVIDNWSRRCFTRRQTRNHLGRDKGQLPITRLIGTKSPKSAPVLRFRRHKNAFHRCQLSLNTEKSCPITKTQSGRRFHTLLSGYSERNSGQCESIRGHRVPISKPMPLSRSSRCQRIRDGRSCLRIWGKELPVGYDDQRHTIYPLMSLDRSPDPRAGGGRSSQIRIEIRTRLSPRRG